MAENRRQRAGKPGKSRQEGRAAAFFERLLICMRQAVRLSVRRKGRMAKSRLNHEFPKDFLYRFAEIHLTEPDVFNILKWLFCRIRVFKDT